MKKESKILITILIISIILFFLAPLVCFIFGRGFTDFEYIGEDMKPCFPLLCIMPIGLLGFIFSGMFLVFSTIRKLMLKTS